MGGADVVNAIWFVGWLMALLVLFVLGTRLPLQPRVGRIAALGYSVLVVASVVGIVVLANVALAMHEMHVDLTREKVFTPSRRAQEVVDALQQDVKLTYFFQAQDPAGKRARDMVEVLGRRNPRLRVRTVDPDKQPTVAETFGVRIYNAAVLEAEGRRVQVSSTDENDIALGILRVLRARVIGICFVDGHNEYPIDNFEFHTHFEGLAGHSHGETGSGVVLMKGHGAGRLRRALEAVGYDVRRIVLATLPAIPPDCSAVVDLNPRTTYLPAESDAMLTYLARGGAVLLAYDLGFVLEPRLAAGLRGLGIGFTQDVVVDPLDHYSTDPEVVAIPVYEPHVITRRIALSFFPGIRSIALGSPPAGVTVAPLFLSSTQSYTRPVATAGERDPGPAPPTPATPRTGRQVLAVAAEGTWPGDTASAPFRLVVVGDGDFASNSFLPYMANGDLAVSIVRWLVREEQTGSVTARIPVPPLVLLTKRQMQQIFVIVEVLLPLSVVLCGALVWWSRR
ncbi:MAG TPA: Gldg family protein [Methylomirabilota bacterium]|nr:Gldg family protein [Methylomirabilota bacterium]